MKHLEKFNEKSGKCPGIAPYNPMEENAMGTLYNQLSEKDRRLYAGAVAMKLPHGGITYVADLLNVTERQ